MTNEPKRTDACINPSQADRAQAFRWEATFTDLRLAGITLNEWLEFHRAERRKAA